MYITDINGKAIEVDDLERAIQVAAQYMQYYSKDGTTDESAQRQLAYWTDVHHKLLELQKFT